MIWRWILGVVVLLVLLLCWTQAGVLVTLGEVTAVDLKVGWFRFRIVPGKEKPPKKKISKKEKKRTSSGKSEDAGKKKSVPKPALADIREAVEMLAPPLKKALGRTCRSIYVEPMRLSVTIGGREEPAVAAELYGRLNAGIWAVMPLAEQLLDIPDPSIHTEVDFDAEKNQAAGTLGVSIRIGTALAVGFGIAVPALRWFLRYLKKHRKRQRTAPEESGVRAA